MGYKYNGSPLNLDVSWRDTAGTQYPASWLRGSTAAQRAAVPSGGVTWEDDPPWYDQQFYWGTDKPKTADNEESGDIRHTFFKRIYKEKKILYILITSYTLKTKKL